MKAITVRGIAPDVALKLKEIASKENKSLNQLLLDLIEIRVGMKKEKKFTRRYDDLDSLFGKWSQQDFEAIQAKIDGERCIDPEIWKGINRGQTPINSKDALFRRSPPGDTLSALKHP